jgi:signal transduction histidine kinase/CheY-like chemotaxis protein
MFHLKKLIQTGTDNELLKFADRRKITIVNTLALLTAFLCIIISTIYVFISNHVLIYGVGYLEAFLYLMVLLLNRSGRYDLALTSVVLIQGGSALYFSLLLGGFNINPELLGIFLACMVWQLVKSQFIKVTAILVILVTVIALKIIAIRNSIEPMQLNTTTEYFTYWAAFVAVALMVYTVFYYFSKASAKNEADQEIIIAERTAELAKANKFKTIYLNETSHDLKGKLHPLGALTHDLVLQWEDAGRPENLLVSGQLLNVINASAKDMLDITTDVLDVAKIEAGKFDQPKMAPFAPTEWLFTLIETYKMNASVDEKSLEVKVKGHIPDSICSDKTLLTRILSNLLANAIKFSPKRTTIQLIVSYINSWLQIEVKNEGKGISEADQEHIFDLFHTSSSSGEGTGLGLPIAKRIVESLNGELWVNSIPGEGSRFTFKVPATEVTDITKQSKTIKYQRFFMSNILIIDDNTASLIATSAQLKRLGIRPYVADSPNVANRILGQIQVDLIIVDLVMPEINGFQFIEQIKRNPKTSHIPILLSTSNTVEIQENEMSNPDGLLPKLSNLDQIYQTIEPFLSGKVVKIRI